MTILGRWPWRQIAEGTTDPAAIADSIVLSNQMSAKRKVRVRPSVRPSVRQDTDSLPVTYLSPLLFVLLFVVSAHCYQRYNIKLSLKFFSYEFLEYQLFILEFANNEQLAILYLFDKYNNRQVSFFL